MMADYKPAGAFGQAGQIFTNKTQAIFYNWKQLPVQRMVSGHQQIQICEAACARTSVG
jgi:hypothetical protein